MTDQPMLTYSEVWPLAADAAGLWLLDGTGPWPSLYINRQSDPLTMAEIELIQHGVNLQRCLLHSTSWRIEYSEESDQNFGIYTFMAAVDLEGFARDRWPTAIPITAEAFEELGRAPRHGAVELPAIPYPFVLEHGIRHLRFLIDTDSDVRDSLDENWRRHLAPLEPAIARMYL